VALAADIDEPAVRADRGGGILHVRPSIARAPPWPLNETLLVIRKGIRRPPLNVGSLNLARAS
jgi:hypothetical protein